MTDKAEVQKLARYQEGTGCDSADCAFCAAWLAGYRGEARPFDSDADVQMAYAVGRRARPRKPVS